MTVASRPAGPRLARRWSRLTGAVARALGTLAVVGVLGQSWPAAGVDHDPECPRWRAAFASMPTRIVVLRTGGPDVRHALEARDGYFQAHGIGVGRRVRLSREPVTGDAHQTMAGQGEG